MHETQSDLCVTFRQLDGDVAINGCSPLELWYEKVRDTPIASLGLFDTGRALRQRLFVERVILRALDFLREDALAGHLYEGELLTAVVKLPEELWAAHPALTAEVRFFVKAGAKATESSQDAAMFDLWLLNHS